MAMTTAHDDDASSPQNDWLGLRDARVLIAGAGGIGLASAAAFLRVGASVALIDNDERALERARLTHPTIATKRADVTDEAAVHNAVSTLGGDAGPDVLVHAVGINRREPILQVARPTWDDIIRVNLTSAFVLGTAAGRLMCERGAGRVVFVSSVAGRLAHADHGAYAASKAGLDQLARTMAREWAASGVTVNTVAPGYIETDLTRTYLERPGKRAELARLIPAGRFGTPSEAASAIVFLASAQAAFITGHILVVDGGRTLV